MTRQRLSFAIVLVWMAMACTRADAQVLTGTITGTIRDESGAVIPGATVRASSLSLIGGPVMTTSNERGMFRMPALAPGEYTIEVELDRFAGYRETGIHLDVETTMDRSVTLKIAGIAESISVQGGTAGDTERSGISGRFDARELSLIPVRRFSMFDFIKNTPGVSPTSASSGADPSVSVFGSGVNESLYLLDGTNLKI